MADGDASDGRNGAGDRNGAEGASGELRLGMPADGQGRPRLPFPVVGIGASAGGLEAYTEFLRACPADSGMAFVLIQHLPPDRESLLVELLARQTSMPVIEVTDGLRVEPDRVYVIRPGNTLTIKDGRLRLGPVLEARGHGRPVDDFFRSLAEEQQERAIAVVFSGLGSNGTAGAEVVKAVGGLVIAQDPETAKFAPMPRSLIDSHLPDYILRPSEVPDALAKYAGHPYAAGEPPAAPDEQTLTDVLAALRARTRHDFAGYRKPTILRRVRRRMGLGQFATVAEYARALRQTPAEVTALADDLLIHVTGFFRDPDAWAALREKVLDPLAEARADGAEIRCWVAACATGEEAYTLAMLLTEAAEERGKQFDIKVFATDMAERALGAARAGVFPNGIESEITPERLARFFDKDDTFYRVKKELREVVIFAPQNVLQDPPFSRLDVATCRNLLIYLEPETQRRVLALLHFGLREGGALLLGSSESAAPVDGDFEAIDKKHRLFRRVGPTRPGAIDLSALAAGREARQAPSRPPAPIPQLVGRALLDRHTPPAVAVDGAWQVVHVHGDTARYLSLPAGGPTHDLIALANDQVRGAVRAALHRAADAHAPVAVPGGMMDTPAGRVRVEVGAAPLAPRDAAPLYLVTFREVPEPEPLPPADSDPAADDQAADELRRVRGELQSVLEETQTSNEEMKAAHEEATSLNEELQSTNEELETSKEEMQSLNEELVTVNAQLQSKMGELEVTTSDLSSLLASTDIPVLFLDRQFRIRRYTAKVRDLIDVIPSDAGRPFADLRLKFADPDLLADAAAVLERLAPVEREVRGESGRDYLRRVLPYRTADDRIDGVVVAFVDITARNRAEEAVRASEEQFRRAIEDAPIPVVMQAEDGQVLQVSRTWTELTGYALSDVPTADAWLTRAYGPGSDAVRAYTHELFRGERGTLDVDFTIRTRAGAERHWAFSASAPGTLADGRRFLVGMAVDITDRKRAEERQAFLLMLSDALGPLADPETTQAEACRLLGEQLGVDRAYYVEIDEDAGTFEVRRDYLRGGCPSLAGRHPVSDYGWAIPPMRRGELLVVPDVADSPLVAPADRAVPLAARMAACVNAPLVKAGRLVGALCVTESAPRAWTEAEADLVRETAERVWAAVERAKADGARRAAEERYLALFNAIDQGFCTIEVAFDGNDKAVDYRFLEVSPSFEQHTGIPDAVGRSMREIAPDQDEHWFEAYGRVARTGTPERFENHSTPLGRWWHVYTFRVGSPEQRRVAVLFTDITGRKRAEERQAFRLRLADALRPLADAAAIEAEATRVLGEHLGAGRVFYAEAEADEDHVQIHRDFTAAGTASIAGRQRLSDFGRPWVDGYRAGRTLATPDFRDVGGSVAAAFEAIGVRACVGVPVNKGGKFVGVLIVHSSAPRRWTALEVALIEETAERTWAAVERAKAEAALRASEARLRQMAANLPNAAVFVVGPDLRYRLAEGQALRDVGKSSADFEGKTLAEAVPPDQLEFHLDTYGRLLAGEPFQFERAIGDRRFIHSGVPLRDEAGTVTAALAVSYDITDRVRAEDALRASEVRYRLLVENAPDHALIALDPAGLVSDWNDSAGPLFGYAAGEIVGRPLDALFTPEDRAAGLLGREMQQAVRTGRAGEENWMVRKDGTRFWASGTLSAVRGVAGELTGFVKVVRDRTEQRAAEAEVREGRERLRLAAEAAGVGIWRWDVASDIHLRDAHLNRMLGLPAAETVLPLSDFYDRMHPDDRPAVEAAFADCVRLGGRLLVEFRVVWPDGTVRWLRDQGEVFGDPDSDSRYLTGAAVDVTDLKTLEAGLRAARDELEGRVAERTAELAGAVGALGAEAASRRDLARRLATAQEDERRRVSRDLHDTVGQTHAGLAMSLAAAAAASPPGEAADRLRHASDLADAMGRELHDAAVRLRPTALDDLGLEAAVRELAGGWWQRTGVAVDFDASGFGGERLAPEAETALYRVVQEALTNAERHAEATRVSVTLVRAGGRAVVTVEDDGGGFDPDSPTARIGLLGMRERVELVGGTLEVESAPGAGTTIIARVPAQGRDNH